ncbi:MAG TPA: ADP-forming succinate--CoA ligase subunit beta [Candidatus Acidoferrum sp.]|jgi:succinyl-CoA synthetase beta subunit|nr:ADP-forming succinate--CoA ligase subunit beta [Candidatus Acidoferrum sp.]
MKIHEYQAKALLSKFGVPVPRGHVAFDKDKARVAAQQLGTKVVVVKAQIHAGGRGKAGGVKLAKSPEEAASLAEHMLGMKLVTPQTGEEGRIVRRLLIEEGLDIKRELYLSVMVDRSVGAPIFMASAAGGMEIEEVAKENPDAIIRQKIDPATGFQAYHARKLAFGLGLPAEMMPVALAFFQSVYRAFLETDASLLEINPLIVTGDGKLVALDAKVQLDDNALYRHPDYKDLRDLEEETPLEVEASKFKLNYIKLDGTIACMVNGAGLAMATMDIIKLSGGNPANFLDVGGGASEEQVKNAFRILLSDPNVKAVFVNIFGGILRCDVLASGVVNAAKELKFKVPVVVRMEGTNVDQGQAILKNSGLNFTVAEGMKDGAQKVVALAGGAR